MPMELSIGSCESIDSPVNDLTPRTFLDPMIELWQVRIRVRWMYVLASKWESAMVNRQDSKYVAHFTKGDKSCSNIENMLNAGMINANNLPWNGQPAVCFTECPWSSLLAHADQYSPYGIGFRKEHVFAAGGGPAYYVRNDFFGQQKWSGVNFTFVTPYWPGFRPAAKQQHDKNSHPIDYLHEREWRVPHDFTFKLDQVEFVILPDYNTMAAFPSKLKNGIGREKFILMDVYRKIEELWPVHVI